MADIANYFATEDDGCRRSDLFSSLFGMFLRKEKVYEETNAEASFLVISTINFLQVTEKFHHTSIEYEESQVSLGSLKEKRLDGNNKEELKKQCQLAITNIHLDSTAKEMLKNKEKEKDKIEPQKYVGTKPEELLDEILEKITGLLSQEEETINEILALDLWEKIEEKVMGIRLKLSTLILVFEKCNDFDAKMRALLEMLTVNFEVVNKFTTEPKRILDILFKRWKIIKVIKAVWEANCINGDLKKEFQLLQDVVKKDISIILDCMDDSEQVLAKREFQSIGVNLNLKNTVYNYNCLLYTSPSPRDS